MSGFIANKKVFIRTFGCQMNDHDSERMAGLLKGEGFTLTLNPEEADLILVNTCSIRDKAEQKAYSELGRYAKLKKARPGLMIGMAGCVAQQEGENILTADLAADDLVEGQLQEREEVANKLTQHGPGYPLLFWLVQVPAQQFISDADQGTSVELQRITAQWVAILSHFLVVLGMLLIGYRHFNNFIKIIY